ncbi:MAG: recombinase RecB, partial [Chitinophagaceae bacterium]
DLHTVLKHSVRAGVESYSLKEMERMHRFTRQRDLKEVRQHKNLYEVLLESDNIEVVEEETKQVVLDYNKEDCLSAKSLRDWLEQLRNEEIEKGVAITRPTAEADQPSDNIKAHLERIQPIFDALTKGVPFEKDERTEEEQARWLLAHMLDWYRREQKSFWWNYLRLKELDADELIDERDAISKLVFTGKSVDDKKSVIHFYSFPEQEIDLRENDEVECDDGKVRKIAHMDRRNLILSIRKGNKDAGFHPTRLIAKNFISQTAKEESIIRLAEWVVANHIDAPGIYRAGRDLLLRNLPRTTAEILPNENAQDKAVDWVTKLDQSVLPIQGPPGTGKSHTAARMIVTLIKQGKKVGITALSHKVISGLLEKVLKAAPAEGVEVKIIQKVSQNPDVSNVNWIKSDKNNEIELALDNSSVNIVAGTSFMWSRENFNEVVDVLFVDEAGQLSLIDTLALSHAAKSLVLLGDPQQLQQPQKGHHPEGTEVSALSHVLKDAHTISSERGVFLDVTWRMHPEICDYVSEMFYSGRLHAKQSNNSQTLLGNSIYNEPGIYIKPVLHDGNSNHSPEEVNVAKQVVEELLRNNISYTDNFGQSHTLTGSSIKIISPYNAQVNALSAALPGIQVGTVDKFQGQEAEVIIFSMATSSPADAPRGMEFLYSLNRLNVAVSRAKIVFILIANPALFEPDCRSPHQMKLANALCRLLEKSKVEG